MVLYPALANGLFSTMPGKGFASLKGNLAVNDS